MGSSFSLVRGVISLCRLSAGYEESTREGKVATLDLQVDGKLRNDVKNNRRGSRQIKLRVLE